MAKPSRLTRLWRQFLDTHVATNLHHGVHNCLGLSMLSTVKYLQLLSYPPLSVVICFGSLSCWKTHPQPIFSVLTEGRRLSPKISRYMVPFILPSIRWSHPVPLAKKLPQSIRFPPPCFRVGWCSWGCTQHLSSSKHGESSWCQIALFWSHLTTSHSPKPPLDHPGVLWQTSDRPVGF